MHCHSTKGTGAKVLTPGVSGPVSQLLTLGLVIRLYRAKGVLPSGSWWRDQFFCSDSISLIQFVATGPLTDLPTGRWPGDPSPQLPSARYMAHIQAHHHLEHGALPGRLKIHLGICNLRTMPAPGSRGHVCKPTRPKQLPSL